MTAPTAAPETALEVEIRLPLAHFELECSFRAQREVVVLFGSSGAGKTSVLDAIAGFRAPRQGRIVLANRVLFCSDSRVDVPVRRRQIGYLSQQPALFPHLTVRQNVAYGLHELPKAEREQRVGAILERFRIAHLAASRPPAISGGEQQRVALARALVCEPQLLLLDEPLAALDVAIKSVLVDELFQWQRERAVPMLYVTHERAEAFSLSRRVLVIDKGRVVADGAPHQVFDAPISREHAALAGYENIFEAIVQEAHPASGTMTCRLVQSGLLLESPLARRSEGEKAFLGIRAGDILVATSRPSGISARNLLPGRIRSIDDREGMAELRILCAGAAGAETDFCVHITRGALRDLQLETGNPIWLILKTHSIQFLREQ